MGRKSPFNARVGDSFTLENGGCGHGRKRVNVGHDAEDEREV